MPAQSKHDYPALVEEYEQRLARGEEHRVILADFQSRGVNSGTFQNRRTQAKKTANTGGVPSKGKVGRKPQKGVATTDTSPPQETSMLSDTIPVEVLPGQISFDAEDTTLSATEDDHVSATADIAPVTIDSVDHLSPEEVQTLEHYEQIIAQGIQTFVQVGQALLAIRDLKLYRADYPTFEEYCRHRWDLSRPYAYQLMEASLVVENVSAVADILPANEAQARPLARLEPVQQQEVWREAVETAPPSGVTAKHVQATVKRVKERASGQKVSMSKAQEPAPRRPARQEVQEGLVWGLREVNDEDAWEMLECLWDGLNDLAPKYPTLRGMLARVQRRFPDGHRTLMELAQEKTRED